MKTSHHHELSADCFRCAAADGILDEEKASNTIQKLNTIPAAAYVHYSSQNTLPSWLENHVIG